MSSSSGDDVVFVLAHQDDEYGAAPWIELELRAGANVRCCYLTDGATRVTAETRDYESLRVLTRLGISKDNVTFGCRKRFADGALLRSMSAASQEFEEWLSMKVPKVVRLYSPAWEGGHPDHDATHAIALLAAVRRGIANDSWQFPLYNAYKCPKYIFRSFSPLPWQGSFRRIRYGWREGWRYAMLCWEYRSQLRTWIGLFPGAFVRRILKRFEDVAVFDPDRVMRRPHDGPLLYDRMFGTTYELFSAGVDQIRREVQSLPKNDEAVRKEA